MWHYLAQFKVLALSVNRWSSTLYKLAALWTQNAQIASMTLQLDILTYADQDQEDYYQIF